MGSYAGIDWASAKHDVLIESAAGEELLGATFAHDEDGVSALCAALACFDVELVAIERPDGLLVDRLLGGGCGCWRCIPIRSRRPAIGSARRAASRIGLIGSYCVSWRALIATASESWSLTRIRPRRSRRSPERVRILWVRGWR